MKQFGEPLIQTIVVLTSIFPYLYFCLSREGPAVAECNYPNDHCGTQDYLHSLGKARTAQVQKDARIGEAKNKRDAVIRVRYVVPRQ